MSYFVQRCNRSTLAILKVSGFDILDNNVFCNVYTSDTYILYWLISL